MRGGEVSILLSSQNTASGSFHLYTLENAQSIYEILLYGLSLPLFGNLCLHYRGIGTIQDKYLHIW